MRRDGLWVKLWDMGVKGRMWRVIKNMYEASRSAILLEGGSRLHLGKSKVWHRAVSPILFSVFINGLLKDVEQAGLGIEISNGKRMGGKLFADEFCRC